jgi:hypothetical protein
LLSALSIENLFGLKDRHYSSILSPFLSVISG